MFKEINVLLFFSDLLSTSLTLSAFQCASIQCAFNNIGYSKMNLISLIKVRL
jgi:hypothetical protein